MAYLSLEPFGDDLIDQHFANLQALLANLNRPKGGRTYKPDDFTLRKLPETSQEELTEGQIFQRFKANLGLS
jgi:hypothetical protein